MLKTPEISAIDNVESLQEDTEAQLIQEEEIKIGNRPSLVPCAVPFVDEDYVPNAFNTP